jgi:hypothetical protein
MSETAQPKSYVITIKGARLSYPYLFKAQPPKEGTGEPKYSAAFILDKATQNDQIIAVKTKVKEVLNEFNKGVLLAPNLYCIRDGSFKPDKPGYGDTVEFISTSNTRRPLVVDHKDVRDAQGKLVPMDPEDKRLFAGCYVNATFRLWFQDNKNGKRVNASLEGVQYVGPGEPFGAEQLEAEEMFGDAPSPGAAANNLI